MMLPLFSQAERAKHMGVSKSYSFHLPAPLPLAEEGSFACVRCLAQRPCLHNAKNLTAGERSVFLFKKESNYSQKAMNNRLTQVKPIDRGQR